MVSTASRVGTGNMELPAPSSQAAREQFSGCGLSLFLGGASAFVESTLAQIYKRKASKGSLRRTRLLHKQSSQSSGFRRSIRSISDTYLYGRIQCPCFIQPYGLRQSVYPFRKCFSDHRRSSSRSSGIVIFGGGKRISKMTQIMVPIMAIAYIGVALIVMILNITSLPSVRRYIQRCVQLLP